MLCRRGLNKPSDELGPGSDGGVTWWGRGGVGGRPAGARGRGRGDQDHVQTALMNSANSRLYYINTGVGVNEGWLERGSGGGWPGRRGAREETEC